MRLFDVAFSEDALHAAWQVTRTRSKTAGIDRVTNRKFEEELGRNVRRLRAEILRGTYRPKPTIRVLIPKANGKSREIEILALRDRLAQRAALTALSFAVEGSFHDGSFGFRPRRGVHTAVYRVHGWRLKGHDRYVLRADVKDCFDSVEHERLLRELRDRRIDAQFRHFVEESIKAGPRGERNHGLAQGAPLSPLLCNIVLDPVDWSVAEDANHYARYADDFCVSFLKRGQAQSAEGRLAKELARVGLSIQPEKTQVVPYREGFRFLGGEFKGNGLRPCAIVRSPSGKEKLGFAYES